MLFFIWQQMVGYILFEMIRFVHLKIPKIVFLLLYIIQTTIFRNYKNIW